MSIKQFWNLNIDVIKRHWLAYALLFLYSMGCGAILESWSAVLGACLLVVGFAVFCYFIWSKKLVAVLIAASLISTPTARAQQQVQPAAGYLAVGILIIVGAGLGIIGCKKVKKCLDKIGKDRNNSITNVEERLIPAGVQPEIGAAFFWSEPGDCYEQRLIPSVPVVYTMCPYIDGTNIIVLTHADVGNEFVEPWKDVVTRHGLKAPTGPGLWASFEIDGQPCEAGEVPIGFDYETKTATVGPGGIVLTVERSEDLKTWEPFLKLNYDDWQLSPRIDDNGEGQAFYRFSATRP